MCTAKSFYIPPYRLWVNFNTVLVCEGVRQKRYLKTKSPRVRALGLLVLVFSHGFSKRIEHIENNM
ncbi:hypothetical protein CON40_01580 [Bacillus cereus]|nr:hypothetical protein CON40_01580 [Bacillus cereus]